MNPSGRLRTIRLVACLLGLAMRAVAAEAGAPSPALVIDDVVLQGDGSLVGRLMDAGADRDPVRVAGMSVLLVTHTRPAAETATDRDGRFVIPHLAGGVYRVVVQTPEGPQSRYCRLWPSTSAPPHALQELGLFRGGPIVCGQAPIPAASFGQVATITGVAAGVLAAPIIYAATKREPWIPASP